MISTEIYMETDWNETYAIEFNIIQGNYTRDSIAVFWSVEEKSPLVNLSIEKMSNL